MLTYDMSKRGRQPLYLYLYQCIRKDILDGTIRPNEKLPSKRALAQHLAVSVITVENAYQLLRVEGYIYSREKSGFYAEHLKARPASAPVHHPFQEEPQEHEYFANFSSNKAEYTLFPISVMAKLSREMLSVQNISFLKTVPYNGTAILRYAIANYLADNRGLQVDPQQIIIGCGTEYLYSRLLECFPEGTVLGLEDPGNHKFARIAGKYRFPVSYLPTDRFGVSSDDLEKSPVTLLHLSPANIFPLGNIMPIRRRLEILGWLHADEQRYLIEDDFDSEFNSYGLADSPVFAGDDSGHTIYINSFSKTMMPSLRVAYMVLPHELMKRYLETTSFYSCTVSSSDQYIVSNFISRGYFERHLQHTNNVFREKKEVLLEELQRAGLDKISRIRTPLAGTSILLEDLQLPCSADVLKKKAEQLDIRLAFAADYMKFPTEKAKRMLVLNYASVPEGRIEEGVKRVCRALTDFR